MSKKEVTEVQKQVAEQIRDQFKVVQKGEEMNDELNEVNEEQAVEVEKKGVFKAMKDKIGNKGYVIGGIAVGAAVFAALVIVAKKLNGEEPEILDTDWVDTTATAE